MLVGVADRARAEAAGLPRAEPGDVDAGDTDRPRRGPVESGDDPQQRRLPRAARPEDDAELAALHAERQALQRRDPAFGGRVDPEEVAQLDERGHSGTSARPGTGAENARRVAKSTSAAAARTYRAAAPTTTSTSRSSTSGGSAAVARAVRPTRSVTTAASATPVSAPATSPAAATVSARSADDPAQQRRRGALRLEVEQLAALVPQVAEHRQQDPGQREPERDGGRDGEREQRSVRDRVATRVGFERVPRLDREHVERLRREGAVDVVGATSVAQPQPDLVHARATRPREIDGRGERVAVPDDGLAVDAWEAPHGRDYADRDPLACDLQREQAPVVCGGGEARRREHRQRLVVGLPRPDPRGDRVGERVVDGRAVDLGAADADPASGRMREVRELDRDRPSQRPAGVGAALLQPRGGLDRDAGEPAAASLGRHRVAERNAQEPPGRPLDLREEANRPALDPRPQAQSPSRGPFARRHRLDPRRQLLGRARTLVGRASRSASASDEGGKPSSVIPLSPSSRPTPPVSRSTGDASTAGSFANRSSEAASWTGISRRRSSRTT